MIRPLFVPTSPAIGPLLERVPTCFVGFVLVVWFCKSSVSSIVLLPPLTLQEYIIPSFFIAKPAISLS